MEVVVENAGVLEIFGPDSKPWRVADDAFLQTAIDLAKTDASAGIAKAEELARVAQIKGIVRFRCEVPMSIVAALKEKNHG